MRKIIMLTTALILLVSLPGCSSKNEQGIFGAYTFKEVSYLSPLSSSTKDSVNRQMKGTKYTIKEDLFKIESEGYTVEYSSPLYVKEEIPDKATFFSDVNTFLCGDIEYQYTIYDKNGSKTRWRLYVSSNCLWIGNCSDNAKGELIMYIYKLSK